MLNWSFNILLCIDQWLKIGAEKIRRVYGFDITYIIIAECFFFFPYVCIFSLTGELSQATESLCQEVGVYLHAG